MPAKQQVTSHFSHAIWSKSLGLRPDTEQDLKAYPETSLARGAGLSYSDCCFNTDGYLINTERLNHLIRFDSSTGILECQAGVTFKELFLVHPDFIPPVLPGTLHATVAGGIANDVHGKNNHLEGSFGHHIKGIELLIGNKKSTCSPENNSELFQATLAGLGLTGIITRVLIGMKKKSRFVQVENTHYTSLESLMDQMITRGLKYDYQVAWLDLLHTPIQGILSLANHCDSGPENKIWTASVPKMPCSLIKAWNMKLFNTLYVKQMKANQCLGLEQFNNPLDSIAHWNRLYGPKGLIQFQVVFKQENALQTLEQILQYINCNQATPTLAVLKLFTQSGLGTLSFCQPGFTLAVDLIHNHQAKTAIEAINQYISNLGGCVYLAKDLLLTKEQCHTMYPNLPHFKKVLSHNHCRNQSDIAKRLGITE
ncbi:MAG: FAD-binding protein [Legionellales bacterium]